MMLKNVIAISFRYICRELGRFYLFDENVPVLLPPVLPLKVSGAKIKENSVCEQSLHATFTIFVVYVKEEGLYRDKGCQGP